MDISRVLFCSLRCSERGQLSIWDACYQTPLAVLLGGTGKRPTVVTFDLAPNRGLPSQHLSMLLVRSYRTFAPLPVSCQAKANSSIGGMFLWHYPHGHPHWALPSKFGLSGARTFLRLDAISRLRQPRASSKALFR